MTLCIQPPPEMEECLIPETIEERESNGDQSVAGAHGAVLRQLNKYRAHFCAATGGESCVYDMV